MRVVLPLLAALVLAACGDAPDTARTDNVDPAATAAVADPIMTDPELNRRSNNDALRPADEPFQALVPPGSPNPLRGSAPPTIAARMARKLAGDPFAGCDRKIAYGFGWASRLPDTLPLPANAAVAEAAGSDAAGCGLRLIAFDTDMAPDALAESYRRAAASTGMRVTESHEGDATVLSAVGTGGSAFVVSVYPAKGGRSAADLLSNRGR